MTMPQRQAAMQLAPSPLDRWARRLVLNSLAGLRGGVLELHDAGDTTRYGTTTELRAGVQVHDARFFRLSLLGGSLSAAESYLRGHWDCDDLTALFRIFLRSGEAAAGLERIAARCSAWLHRLVHWRRRNTPAGSRRNIAAHYDLGNDFYRLWLDDTLAYSSAIFPTPSASLAEGSREKFDRACRKLELHSSDELLEIGAGWGGLALHAAARYGCRVTTTTISRQQYEEAAARVATADLDDRVTVLCADYRDLRGTFDKLASIEMIEAVGYRHLDQFFGQCSALLRPQGTMLLQAIVMPEQGYRRYLKSVDFIQRYVFPGGCLPSINAMLQSAGRATDMRLVHVEDFAPHYAETLRRWRTAFETQRAAVEALGYPERFIRLWRYYLCYCEAAFEERHVGVVQLQFDKPSCRRDPLRIGVCAAQPYGVAPPVVRAMKSRVGSAPA